MKRCFPLSAEQKSLWIEWLLNPNSTLNNVCFFYKIEGKLDVSLFLKSVNHVTSNALPFQMRLIRRENAAFYCINNDNQIHIDYMESKALFLTTEQQELEYLHNIINQPFDLLSEKNYRLILLKSHHENIYFFVACLHHILIDGYSGNYLLKNISNAYNTNDFQSIPTTNKITFISSEEHNKQEKKEYWLKKIKKINGMIDSNYDLSFSKIGTSSKIGTRSYLFIDKKEIKTFKKTCFQNKTTTFLGLMAAFGSFLHRYFDISDFPILYSVDLRTITQKNYLGTYVNLIPMLFSLSENDTFVDILNKITQQRKFDKCYQNYSLDKIISLLRKATNWHNFNIIFSKATILPNNFHLNDVDIEYVSFYPKTSITDLALLYDESDNGFIFTFEYDSSLFDKVFIQNMLMNFKEFIVHLGENPAKKLIGYPILSKQEKEKILQVSSPKQQSKAQELKSVIEQFKIIAQQFPNKIAIISENEKYTYQQLNEYSNQIARYLLRLNSSKSIKIAFLLPRTYSTIVIMLGIVKASCTYVPLDSSYPLARLQYIIDDANIELFITDNAFKSTVKNLQTKKIIYSNQILDKANSEETSEIVSKTLLTNSAYIIYTSGSTGTPKGVPISHYNLARLFEVTKNYFYFKPSDKWSLFHSFAFDFSVWEIWGAILNGSELHILSDNVRISSLQTYLYIYKYQITVFNQTPFAFKQFLTIDHEQKKALALRFVIFGGEKLTPSDLQLWFLNHPENHPNLINMYGLTEATVHATYYHITQKDSALKKSLIGNPLADLGAYVLNKNHQLIPFGVVGELFLEGPGLTEGYLNQEKLNKSRFISLTFLKKTRLYATGDLVRWLPDGNLEYIERKDKQVKLNGYRIELDEISIALQHLTEICHAVAFAHELENRQIQLIGFYQTKNYQPLDTNYILHHLKKSLPYYMIPSRFILLEHMPLTSQGKLDKKYLQQLAAQSEAITVKKLIASSSIKEQVLQIWQDALNDSLIKSTDAFFEIGGNSIILLDIHAKIQQLFDLELPITDLFNYPTVDKFTEYLVNKIKNEKDNLSIDNIQNNTISSKHTNNEAIAIIGMAANLPKAPSIQQFWQNLQEGKEGITFFSEQEMQDNEIPENVLKSSNYVKAKGFIDNAFDFDANFFGISPSEATILDPQHRLLLECAWTALEDAGYPEEKQGKKTGVFLTQSNIQNYLQTYLLHNPFIKKTFNDYQLYINNSSDFLATKISYKFNFTGPSYTVQSGCSSSLVAIIQACQSLYNNECDLAIAGGVTLTMPLKSGYPYQKGMILSPDGHCRVFDSKANGTVPGNGAGVVVLKRLSDAITDHDHIEAIIKGFAINNDGANKVSFTAPNQQGQSEVIEKALQKANCSSNDISYIEAHGTATFLGDPIEIAALQTVFKEKNRIKPCMIGSVKSNIGHLDAAAGIASFIKTVLCLKNKYLVPNLHFHTANKDLNLENTLFSIVTEYCPWITKQLPRRAGVSSFAVGGTNAHVILEEAPCDKGIIMKGNKEQLITLSAKTRTALMAMSQNIADFLNKNPNCSLQDFSYTLQVGRKHFDYRLAFTGTSHQEISSFLNTVNCDSKIIRHREASQPIVFLFPGQGASFLSILKVCYQKFPVFTQIVDFCKKYLKQHHNLEIASYRQSQNPLTSMHTTLGIFISEYALAKQWIEWGVYPSALLGHSLGQYVAACIAGVWSLEDTLEILFMRSTLISTTAEGKMLSISLNKEELHPYLNNEVALAAENSFQRCVLSGSNEAIEIIRKKLIQNNIPCKLLDIPHGYHSPLMDSIGSLFFEKLQEYIFHSPRIPIISNVTGTWLTENEARDPKYWADHLCCTVQFSSGIKKLLDNYNLYIELGEGSALSTFVKQHKNTICCYNMQGKHKKVSYSSLLETIGLLWSERLPIDWHNFYAQKHYNRISLPTYPFERKTYWVKKEQKESEPLIEKIKMEDWFYVPMWEYSDFQSYPSYAKDKTPLLFLIFKDNFGISDNIIFLLKKIECTIITVNLSRTFISKDNDYQINPYSLDHYEELATNLSKKNQIPNKILYCWPLLEDIENSSYNPTKINDDLTSLIYLCKMLFSFKSTIKIDLYVVTNGLWVVSPNDKIVPKQSLLLGPILTLPQESSSINCYALDVGALKNDSSSLNRLSTNVFNEITNKQQKEHLIAYRNNRRLVKSYNKIVLSNKANTLSSHGIYIITGGLGAIGLSFAKYLAQNSSAIIILLQRSSFPPRQEWEHLLVDTNSEHALKTQINKLKEIEALGSTVHIIKADVRNFAQIKQVLKNIQNKFGKITGVMHAAGIAGGGMLQTITPEKIKQVLEPKVLGAISIYHALKANPPHFTIFCSALTSITGYFGQAIYNSANCFLDNFAAWLSTQQYPALSINWDTWQGIGMASKINLDEPYNKVIEKQITTGIKENEAIQLFPLLLKTPISQLIISTTALEEKCSIFNNIGKDFSNSINNKLNNIDKKILHTVYSQLEQVWKDCLGLQTIHPEDNFFELGGDSLLGVQLTAILKEQFNIDIRLQDLIEAPTFAALVERSKLRKEQSDKLQQDQNFPLILLRKGAGDVNLFLIHPVGGTAFIYRALAEKINPTISVYGLQSRSLDNITAPINQVESMALDYINCISSIQPNGQYYLAGASFGGTLAYEVAQQLISKNQKINFLALVDTPGLEQMPIKLPTEAEILAYMLQTGAQTKVNLEHFYALGLEEQLEYFITHAGGLKKALPSFDIAHMKRYLKIYQANIEAMFKYLPKPYKGDNKIHYFKATERDSVNPPYPELGWQALLNNKLLLHLTSGNHITALFEPYVSDLAQQLNRLLDEKTCTK